MFALPTKSSPVGWIFVLSTLIVITVGTAIVTGFLNPAMPREANGVYMWYITLPEVIGPAFTAGLKLCAITLLLLFLIAAVLPREGGQLDTASIREQLYTWGGTYIAAVFITILLLGVGLINSPDIFSKNHLTARLGMLVAILFGLGMIADLLLVNLREKFQFIGKLETLKRLPISKLVIPGLVIGGLLIGLCQVPPREKIYLGVLNLLALKPFALRGYSFLVYYSLIYVLPLIGIVEFATAQFTLNRLENWSLNDKGRIQLALGGAVIVMGLLILATV